MFLKLCRLIVEMCIWFKHIYFVSQLYKHTNIYDDNTSYGIRTEAFGFLVALELILTELRLFKLKYFGCFFPCRVWRLCNQLLLQFLMLNGGIVILWTTGDVHVGF